MSFYSELRACNKFEYSLYFEKFHADLRNTNCIIVNCQNVCDYFHAYKVIKDGGFGINELFNIKCPFNEIFFEMEVEKVKIGLYLSPINKSLKYLAICFIKFPNTEPFAAALFTIDISENGTLLNWCSMLNKEYENSLTLKDATESKDVLLSYLYISLLTVQFMHCKNVKTVENDPNLELPSRVRKHWEKKGKPPLEKYYTLEIEPMKEVLKKEGGIEHNGLKKALHICRGHFAVYDEKPLFGKIYGTFWKPAHIRGSIEYGQIIKDYNVKL